MKIVHILRAAPFGGAQRLAVDIAAGQRQAGEDAHVILCGKEPQRARAAAQLAGVPISILKRGVGAVRTVHRLCHDADILHLHMPPAWLGAILPTAPAKVLHLHVRPVVRIRGRSLAGLTDRAGERLLLARSDRVIAISNWIAQDWTAEYCSALPPVSIVHNGVAVPAIQPRPEGSFTIGLASRLSNDKGIDEFIAFAAALHRQAPDIVFRIAGDGAQRAHFEQLARCAGLGDALIFEGFVADIDAFWSRVHLSVFTSPFEPFGLSLIEPLARGVPGIAYRTGSGSDEIIDLCPGIAAVPRAASESLAELALSLRADPDRLDRMARQGRGEVARHFSVEKMLQGIAEAYREAAK